MQGLPPGRQALYDTFADQAARVVEWLSRIVAGDPGMRSELQSRLHEFGESRLPPADPSAVQCSLIQRGGLGGFTVRTPVGWRIAVHEHTPQLLNAFAQLLFTPDPDPATLTAILDVDARDRPETLLQFPFSEIPEDELAVSRSFGEFAINFVLAHEFGHMMLGQDTSEALPDPQLEAAGLPATFASAQEEMDADAFAALAIRVQPEQDVSAAKAGARIFFELAHWISMRRLTRAGADSVDAYLNATHPHPVMRLAVMQLLAPSLSDEWLQQDIQDRIDTVIGRPSITRRPQALATLRELAADAPAKMLYQRLMVPGRNLIGAEIEEVLAPSGDQAVACVAWAAQYYADENPYRWANPIATLGFATLWSRFVGRGGLVADYARILPVVLEAIPEIDELLELQLHTVHWRPGQES